MTNCVLHERLEQHRSDLDFDYFRVETPMRSQAFPKTSRLNVEIRLQESHLLLYAHPLTPGALQGISKDFSQLFRHPLGALRIGLNQVCQHVESIEKKVRIDLGLQSPHLSPGSQLTELMLLYESTSLGILAAQPFLVCGEHQGGRSSEPKLPAHVEPLANPWAKHQPGWRRAFDFEAIHRIRAWLERNAHPFCFQLAAQDPLCFRPEGLQHR